MKTLTLAASAVAALAAVPALAGGPTIVEPDPVVVSPPPAAVAAPITYDWSGFYAGAQLGWGQVNGDDGTVEDEGNGIIGGVHAGYDWDFGNVVVGLGADYDAADIEFDDTDGSLDSVTRAKLRVGYDAGKWLFYGTGGPAWATADLAGTDYSDQGWFAGAGAEYRINENVSLAGEALYHQFDDFDDTGIDVDTTTVQARVSYRF
ncbi:outer membrane protein [Pseudoruegeria sp. HB172150]|uniref:outer membrane protein n=1 Tax=Pseudoruegeria sp. HB172150 TaxID=2721164 RepID=UPI001551E242|nr:porin family protein [Pseudoruegeria sp. HB172150]